MSTFRPSVLLVFTAVLAGCGGDAGPGPSPSQVQKTAGDNQVGVAGQPLAGLEVTVLDGSGNPLSGVTVTWAAASGGGSVTPTSTTTASDGKATATRTLGPNAGTQTTSATVSGVAPATFTHVARVQGATQMSLSAGTGQSDTVLATLAVQLAVLVRQETNAAVQGVDVTWTPPTGGAVNGLATTSTATDANGIATVVLTLGPTSGNQVATAAVTGLIGSPIQFATTARAGHATTLVPIAGATTGTPGSVVTLSVKATDAHQNASPGDTVAWTVVSGGGSVAPDTSITDANGVSATQHTLGSSVGLDSVAATAFGQTVRFALTIVAAPAVDTVTVGPGIVFSPSQITIASGGTAVFVWAPGSVTHGVKWLTAPGGAALPANSADKTSGSYSLVLTTPGTYTYECTIHGGTMTGSVIVQ